MLRVYARECVFTDICPVSTSICEDLGVLAWVHFLLTCAVPQALAGSMVQN